MPHGRIDDQDKRIMEILETEDLDVDQDLLEKYRDYLNANIKRPCLLTGTEDFPWEEYYVMGPGSKAEYEKLKKTKPSYKDTFEFIVFYAEDWDEDGMVAKVKRVSDNKQFDVRLDHAYTVAPQACLV